MADQLLSTVSHHSSLPDTYVRPESQRPRLHEVVRDANIPTIDLGSPDVSRIIAQVGDACRSFGFFQVVNHGVPVELMLAMMAVASEFFGLPPEEKAKHYSDDPTKKMRLSTSFNIRKETVRNWRDYLRLHCYPLEEFVPGWPSNPASFKEVVSGYCREVRQLGLRLLGLISLSLGLEEDYMVKVLGAHRPKRPHDPSPGPQGGWPAGSQERQVDRCQSATRCLCHQHRRPATGRNHERRHPSEIFCSDMPFRPTKICHGHLEVADEVKRCHPIASVPVDFLSSCSYPLWKS
ncbi:flavanone 3-dioxygenase 2-like isoform X3 [Musa acuminata AAA Group]|uniref:flavanone 3-dioxygenase 2-like isoform X3 n=1 Tax=Musa acuminata AAA Group TaxID=214697 RepID=UPI0031D1910B